MSKPLHLEIKGSLIIYRLESPLGVSGGCMNLAELEWLKQHVDQAVRKFKKRLAKSARPERG